MDDTSKTDPGGIVSDDLDDLLSMHVSKDYINCVWTKEMDPGRSPKKLVIADVVSEEDADKASDDTKTTGQVSASHDPVKIVEPSIISKKKKKKKGSKARKDHKNPICKTSMKAKTKVVKCLERNVRKESSSQSAKPSSASVSDTKEEDPAALQIGTSKSTKTFSIVSRQEKIDPKSQLKVNGFDDTLCTTDENLFSAYKNLVVHRSLPPYTPKELDPRFFSGNYFNCRACGDKFVLQTSFIGHMSRKTAKFSYKCPTCKVQLCFDNRCNFLIHISSHGMDADDIKPGDFSVLPPSCEESECDAIFKNTSSNYTKCPECSKLFISLQLHLQGQESKVVPWNSTGNVTLSCDECALLLPSKCALSAHARYHKEEPPYLCPECGEEFLKSSTLLKHMDEECLHDTKRTVFQCGYCRVVVASHGLFTEHLVAKHLRPIYKCHMCGLSLGTFEDFNAHRTGQHNLRSVEALSGTAALCAQVECDKCPGVSINADSLQDHAATHTLDPKIMTTVYQCKICQCMFAGKRLMLSHKSTCQGKPGDAGDALPDGSKLLADVPPSQFTVPSEDQAGTLQASPAASEASSVSGNRGSVEAVSDNNRHVDITQTNDATRILDNKPLDNDDGVTVSGTDKTGQIHVFKKNVVCKLCKKVVSVGADKAVIKRHFSTHHFSIFMKAIHSGGSGQLPMHIVYTRSKDAVSKSDKEIVDKFVRAVRVKGDIAKMKTRIVETKRSKSKAAKVNTSPLKIGAETKKMRVVETDGFQCYKCSFRSEDMTAFRDHIVLHKSNSSELQCPECGLCFIVRPPLEKHLIAEHGIRKVDKYMLDNGFEDHASEEDEKPVVPEVESDLEGLQENQCKVCRKKFESALLLEKHFRVHGGAFLLANLKAKRSSQ